MPPHRGGTDGQASRFNDLCPDEFAGVRGSSLAWALLHFIRSACW
jgi:hypothetical protein